MRAAVWLAALAALAGAGCDWTIDHERDWLPLMGEPPSLDGLPEYAGPVEAAFYQASDGRIWAKTHDWMAAMQTMGGLKLRSFDAAAEERRYPTRAFVAAEGVVVPQDLSTPDAQITRLRLTLDRLGAGATVTRVLDQPPGALPPAVVRGPGFFVVAPPPVPAGGGSDVPPISILSDDGATETIDNSGPERWGVSVSAGKAAPVVDVGFEGSARFVLLHGDGNALAAWDRATHALVHLGTVPAPVPIPMDQRITRFLPPPSYLYDDVHERLWLCGVETATVSLLTGERQTFPFACIDLRYQRGGELLVQAPDGNVYAVAADGSAVTPLAALPAYGIRYTSGRTILYSHGPEDEHNESFTAWLGDVNLVHNGMSAQFSADGQRLYWLEDVALQAGDLVSYDLGRGTLHRLARNVTQFAELPDGRLVAIANAAFEGPFNRAILVDEAAGETRWLMANAQRLARAGNVIVGQRVTGSTLDSYLLAIPPK